MFVIWGLPGLVLWSRLRTQRRTADASATPRWPARTARQLGFFVGMAILWPIALARWSKLKVWANQRPWLFDMSWLAAGDLAP
jgi:hypothetical protein